MATCEKCAALEREVEALKKEKGELEKILHKEHFEALRTIAYNTGQKAAAWFKARPRGLEKEGLEDFFLLNLKKFTTLKYESAPKSRFYFYVKRVKLRV